MWGNWHSEPSSEQGTFSGVPFLWSPFGLCATSLSADGPCAGGCLERAALGPWSLEDKNLSFHVWILSAFLGVLVLLAANRQAKEREWGGMVVPKNILGYTGMQPYLRRAENQEVESSGTQTGSSHFSGCSLCWSRVFSGPAMFSPGKLWLT